MHDIADRDLDIYDRFNTVRLTYTEEDELERHKEALIAAMQSFANAVEATEWHHMDLDRFRHGLKERIDEGERIQSELTGELPDQALDGLAVIITELRDLVSGGFPDPDYGETTEAILETQITQVGEVAELIADVLDQAKRQSKHLHHLEENAFE